MHSECACPSHLGHHGGLSVYPASPLAVAAAAQRPAAALVCSAAQTEPQSQICKHGYCIRPAFACCCIAHSRDVHACGGGALILTACLQEMSLGVCTAD